MPTIDVNSCPHPPQRLWAWRVADALGKTLCIACCDCGAVLRGGDDETERLLAEQQEDNHDRPT